MLLPRRDFIRLLSVGTAAVWAPARLRAAPGSTMSELLAQLATAEQRGVYYLQDSLKITSQDPAALKVHSSLTDPARYGRRREGWTVDAGLVGSSTWATLRDRPMLGNRSQLAQFSFRSTQAGVTPGNHGLIEMRLCRGTTPEDIPVRVRIENGAFYILSLNVDKLLAGDRAKPVVMMTPGTVYTLTVLLFQKAVYARLTGADVPAGAIELVVADRRRFIPGFPGFGLRTNPQATRGGLEIFDWRVTPVGPATNCRLGVIGDSITAGIDGEPEAESYVHLATQSLGQEFVLNTGSGGSSTTLDLGRFPYEIAPFRPAIVWIEGGTNDIGTGVKAATAFQNMQRQAALITWGGRAVFSTVPPRVLPTPAHYAELTELNRLIRTSGRPIVDRYALVVDPADPRHIRADFCHTDGIHITRSGQALIAQEAARLFKSLTINL